MPISASSGLDFRHPVISFFTSACGGVVLAVALPSPAAKWQAICCDTSSRIASGSGAMAHGLRALPLSRIVRCIRPVSEGNRIAKNLLHYRYNLHEWIYLFISNQYVPLDSLEIRIRLARAAPVSCPTIVTRLGSPPNAAIFSLVHCRAEIMSKTPRFPGGLLERVFRKPKLSMGWEQEGEIVVVRKLLEDKLMCGSCRLYNKYFMWFMVR